MPINIPNNATEIEQRQKTDVQRALPNSNPFLPNSWLGALITSLANRIFDFYIQLKSLIREMFWHTSTGDFLKIQLSWFGFTPNTATQSSGNIVVTGTQSSVITDSDLYVSSDGIEYEVLQNSTIQNNIIQISSITRVGNTATVITAVDHGMSSNVTPTISGANEVEYNLSSSQIQVTGLNSFTYQVSGNPATPATGTIQLSANFAIVPIRSVEFQSNHLDVNLDFNTKLSLQTPIAGVDNDAHVDFEGVTGGTEEESDDDFRTRGLEGIQNPTAHFNVQAIKDKAKEVAGVTRVFVQEITPDIGQVTIYFVRDNDANIIPNSTQVQLVRDALLTIKPANTSNSDMIVSAPTANTINFTFDALTPDTPTMRFAIENNLEQFFKESTDVGATIDEDAYRAAIFSTVDPETGDQVQTFSLAAPIGDINNTLNELSVLGVVNYAIV